ncbi:MAG: hypothetical protein IJ592_03180, partial [Candidatus Methanomethylophilaceae archaeon]|nr:hypothetical protein [Candidatus Methanomethylophilaceae archaeon]
MAYEKKERRSGSKHFEKKDADRPYRKDGQGDRRPRRDGKDFSKGPKKDFDRRPHGRSDDRRRGNDHGGRPRREFS